MAASSAAAAAAAASAALDAWWDDVNSSPLWQDRTFHALAALYGVVALVALVSPNPNPSPHDFTLPLYLCSPFDWGPDFSLEP
jgi:hypothetical protein